MKIIAVTQARVGSSRLPGKVLKTIQGVSLLQIHLERIIRSRELTKVVVATTHEPQADEICRIAKQVGVDCYKGDTQDVLDRFYQAVCHEAADYIVRLTSDCPLIDPVVIDQVIRHVVNNRLDYASNTMEPTFPDGMDVEVFTFKALEKAWKEAIIKSDREHVTPYIWRNASFKGGELFRSDNVRSLQHHGTLRLTVDEPADLELVTRLVSQLGRNLSWQEYVQHMLLHPELLRLNSDIIHNEGYLKSLLNDI